MAVISRWEVCQVVHCKICESIGKFGSYQGSFYKIARNRSMYKLSYSELEGAWIYKDNWSLRKQNSNEEQLNEQLKSYQLWNGTKQ